MTNKKRVVAYLSDDAFSYATVKADEQNRSISNFIENLIIEDKKKTDKVGQEDKEN